MVKNTFSLAQASLRLAKAVTWSAFANATTRDNLEKIYESSKDAPISKAILGADTGGMVCLDGAEMPSRRDDWKLRLLSVKLQVDSTSSDKVRRTSAIKEPTASSTPTDEQRKLVNTTYSCVGVFQPGKVIANNQGNRTTPSYVTFTDTGGLIGDPAKNQVAINPIFSTKRLIGRKGDDSTVQNDMKHWLFTVINNATKPKLEVEYQNEARWFTPEEISAVVLTNMKDTTKVYLGHEVKEPLFIVLAY